VWEWLGDDLAIDFANTVKRRGVEYEELLGSPAAVSEWAGRQNGRVPAVRESDVAGRLDEIVAVRDDVFAVLRAASLGEPPPEKAAERLDARARRHAVVPQLGAERGGAGSAPRHRAADVVLGAPAPLDELLARVVDATVRLAGDADDLGLCDAPSCGQFFLRTRANQRWCGPACGNRARVARHAHPGG
jgi:predicted RNA-binding Zn ribbon-like protein